MSILKRTLALALIIAPLAKAEPTHDAGSASSAQIAYRLDLNNSTKGAEGFFTGDVQVDRLFPSNEAVHFSGAYVTFQPGARTAWHLHPAGQHMIVTQGVALTGTRDGTIIRFKAGDTVWCPPDVEHWHGATPEASMTHLVITGIKDGQNVIWREKVTDEQYLSAVAKTSEKKAMNKNPSLSLKYQTIIPIAAFTASGDLAKLKSALIAGLDQGLTVNEIKEVLVQLYAYAGFPRSLNGISTFMSVLEARKANGINDTPGMEASPLPSNRSSIDLGTENQTRLIGAPAAGAYIAFAPAIDQFLKGHLFGDIFGRDNLDFQTREVATIAALANMDGVGSQLQAHFRIGLNVGLTKAQLDGLIEVLAEKVGQSQSANAAKLLMEILPRESPGGPGKGSSR